MTSESYTPLIDSVHGHWVDRWLPAYLKPYARLARWDRPIGWWLLLLPCWWSILLASLSHGRFFHTLGYGLLFFLGAVSMRGAGCTYNDLIDRDLDAQVARTRSRPLPAGEVSPLQAVLFLGLQALVGLCVLLQLPPFAQGVGVASLTLVAFYPFAKRLTHYPQVFIGLAFSWGALMGWAAVAETLATPALLLYVGTVAWSIGYDTIYGLQDRDDDACAGILSLTRTLGAYLVVGVASFYMLAVVLISAAFFTAHVPPLAYLGIILFGSHLTYQVRRLSHLSMLSELSPTQALDLFRSNRTAGFLLLMGLFIPFLAPFFLPS